MIRHVSGRLGAADLTLIEFAGRHGMVSEQQLAAVAGWSAATTTRHLRRLEEARLVQRQLVWRGRSPVVRATGRGLALAGLDLVPAQLDLARIRHSLSVVDLSRDLLAITPGSGWITEREVRRDRMRAWHSTWGDRRNRRTPDGVLRLPTGGAVAVELDLTPKRTGKLELLVTAYALDREVTSVLWYLPSTTAVARMREVVVRRGLTQLVEPRLFEPERVPW